MSYVFSLIGGLLGIINIIVKILIGWFLERLFISDILSKLFFYEDNTNISTISKQNDNASNSISKIAFDSSRDISIDPPE